MSQSRIPSPARSLGAPVTPRRTKSRTRSVGSPARSTTSGRLSALIQFKENNKDSFVLSPAPSRRSVLNDNTDIEEPRRRSWWKNLADNSRDVMEVLNDNKIIETNEAVEELIDIEVLSQEKKNFSIDIPESSDSESISSIVIPQRKLFTQKDHGHNKFGQVIGARETLAKLHKSHVADKTVNVAPKNLFGHGTKARTKPVFPAALLNLSPNKTANKTKENVAAEVKGQVRNLFGNRAGTKRKNMFADFIVSESEDEISEIQPRVFGFPNKADTRRESGNSRGKREHSPTSSVTTDIEMDDWKMLPSSTMVENQLEDMMASKTPVKRARLSKLAETKESEKKSTADPIEKERSDEEQELKYEDDDDRIEQNEQNQNEHELVVNEDNNHDNDNQRNVQLESNRSKNMKEKDMTIENSKLNQQCVQNQSRGSIQNISKVKVQNLNQSKILNVSQQKNNVSQKKVIEKHKISQNKAISEEAMEVESEQEQNKSHIQNNKSHRELQVSCKENAEKIDEQNEVILHNENQFPETEQLQNIDYIEGKLPAFIPEEEIQQDNNVAEVNNYEEDLKENNQKAKEVIVEQKQNETVIKEHSQVSNADVSDKQEINNTRKGNDASHEKSQNNREMAAVEADEVEDEEEQKHPEEEEDEAQEECEVQNESETEEQESGVKDPAESDNEDQNVSEEEIHNESEVIQQNDESEEDEIAMDGQEENDAEQNVSEIVDPNESEVQDQEESEDEAQNESEAEQQNESLAEAQNKSAMENEENEQEIAEDEVNDSEQEEFEDNDVQNNSEVENDNDENQNESEVEMPEESAEVQDEIEEDAQNESNEEQDEMDDDEQKESAEIQEEEEDETQNESAEFQEDIEDEAQNESAEIQEETDEDVHNDSQEAQAESEDEIQDSNDQQESENEQERNETHDTTGRHRKKDETDVNSPEAILHDKTNQMESFTAQGRNTSVRKTTMLKNLNIKPSLAPPRESTGLSDGTRNSSAEGSGWDSHRTTRKTLRQTFGRDFTPRKSLRALVMEKSAKRQTAMNELTSVTAKFPQANSTELPEASMAPNDSEIVGESNHDVSKRTRQTTLEMYLQKIKKQNMERKLKMEEAVKNSLKAPTRDLNPFKVPVKPMFSTRKPNKVASKPKAKPVKSILIPLDDLPAEVIEDMKYKPPKRFQPSNASWITKRLYKFLESKLESKYDYKARVRAEKLVETIYHFCKDLRRVDVAPTPAVDALKHEMARLDVVKTHFDFYQFFHEYMPREIRVKVVPDVVNKINLPRHGVFSDIIRGNTVQG